MSNIRPVTEKKLVTISAPGNFCNSVLNGTTGEVVSIYNDGQQVIYNVQLTSGELKGLICQISPEHLIYDVYTYQTLEDKSRDLATMYERIAQIRALIDEIEDCYKEKNEEVASLISGVDALLKDIDGDDEDFYNCRYKGEECQYLEIDDFRYFIREPESWNTL